MKRLACCLISLAILFNQPKSISAEEVSHKVFKTKYTMIHYNQDSDIDDFIWRLGGQRVELSSEEGVATNCVDRIVERVGTILDMPPKSLKINIYLHQDAPSSDKVAFYEHKSRSIHVDVDYASDGVVAHEIAHAIICQYFASPPPNKIQEILAQYVDKYLWSDY